LRSPTPSSARQRLLLSPTRRSARQRLLHLVGRILTNRVHAGRILAHGRRLSPPTTTAHGARLRVLLLRPDHIGDVLLTSSAVALLRASLPDAELTYVVGPWSAAAARYGPPVDHVRTLAYPGFTRQANAHLLAPYILLLREAFRLRRETYDVAVVFRPDHWWGALLALAAGIPLRIGGATPETSPLLTHTLPPAADRHTAETSLAIAHLTLTALAASPPTPAASPPTHAAAAQPLPTKPSVSRRAQPAAWASVFDVPRAAQTQAERLWNNHGLSGRTVVAVQPNAGVPLKSWPLDRWAALADALADSGLAVILVGAPDDQATLDAIAQHARSSSITVTLCGQPLDVSAAIYARCAALVAPDSGAAHLAAAVGTPTVRLYGPAPPAVFGPWPARPDQRVLLTDALPCVPCGHLEAPPCGAERLPACMLALGVTDVLKAVETLVRQG
jgi:ADP-heptose:LPS heptosyltransferase